MLIAVNKELLTAEAYTCATCFDTVLACLTCYASFLCVKPPYQKVRRGCFPWWV
jgi:hypothetical protein